MLTTDEPTNNFTEMVVPEKLLKKKLQKREERRKAKKQAKKLEQEAENRKHGNAVEIDEEDGNKPSKKRKQSEEDGEEPNRDGKGVEEAVPSENKKKKMAKTEKNKDEEQRNINILSSSFCNRPQLSSPLLQSRAPRWACPTFFRTSLFRRSNLTCLRPQ